MRSSLPEQQAFYYVKKVFPDAINGYRHEVLSIALTASEYICGNRGLGLEFDIYIPSLSMVIEYDGVQHNEPGQKWNDSVKNYGCQLLNIKMIRIAVADIPDIKTLPGRIEYKVGSRERYERVLTMLLHEIVKFSGRDMTVPIINLREDKEKIKEHIHQVYQSRSLGMKFPELNQYFVPELNHPSPDRIASNNSQILSLECPNCHSSFIVNKQNFNVLSAFDVMFEGRCYHCDDQIESHKIELVKKLHDGCSLSDFEERIARTFLQRAVLMYMSMPERENQKFLLNDKVNELLNKPIGELQEFLSKYKQSEDNLYQLPFWSGEPAKPKHMRWATNTYFEKGEQTTIDDISIDGLFCVEMRNTLNYGATTCAGYGRLIKRTAKFFSAYFYCEADLWRGAKKWWSNDLSVKEKKVRQYKKDRIVAIYRASTYSKSEMEEYWPKDEFND